MATTLESLNELAAAWSASILRATWQGALAIVVALVLVRSQPALPARVACWVWRLAGLKLIAALLVAAPLVIPLLPAADAPWPSLATVASGSHPPRTEILPWNPNPVPARRSAGSPASPRPSAASVVFLCWLFGVFGAAIVAARDCVAVVRLRRSCRPIDRPDLLAAVAELASGFGLRSVPELRAGQDVVQPMLVGVLRPAILLPDAMVGEPRSTAALRAILAHELAHVRRCDLVWSGLAVPVRALFFFHPLVWLAHHEALVAREAACDTLALWATGLRPAEYGRILLSISTGDPRWSPRWTLNPGMAGSTGSLKRRLIAMKTTEQPSRRRLVSWALALLIAGAAGIMPWQLVRREARAQGRAPVAPAMDAARPGHDRPAAPTPGDDRLKLAERRLEVAQAEQKVAQAEQKVAEELFNKFVAIVERWQTEVTRLEHEVNRGVVDRQVLVESLAQLKSSQAARDAARTELARSRASLVAASAVIREAKALGEIDRAESQKALYVNAEHDLKKARVDLREARHDRARAERDAARVGIDQAEANLATAEAKAGRWQSEVKRLKSEVNRGVVDPQVLLESRLQLKSSLAARDADAAQVGLARARLTAAEARLRFVDAESGAADRGTVPPRPIATH